MFLHEFAVFCGELGMREQLRLVLLVVRYVVFPLCALQVHIPSRGVASRIRHKGNEVVQHNGRDQAEQDSLACRCDLEPKGRNFIGKETPNRDGA